MSEVKRHQPVDSPQTTSNIKYVGESQSGQIQQNKVLNTKETLQKSDNKNFDVNVKQTNLQVGVPSAKDLPVPEPKNSIVMYSKELTGLQLLITGNTANNQSQFKFYAPAQAENIFAVIFSSNYDAAVSMLKTMLADWKLTVNQNASLYSLGQTSSNLEVQLGVQQNKQTDTEIKSNWINFGLAIAGGVMSVAAMGTSIGEGMQGTQEATENPDAMTSLGKNENLTSEESTFEAVEQNGGTGAGENQSQPIKQATDEENNLGKAENRNIQQQNDQNGNATPATQKNLKDPIDNAGKLSRTLAVLKKLVTKPTAYTELGKALVGQGNPQQPTILSTVLDTHLVKAPTLEIQTQTASIKSVQSTVSTLNTTTTNFENKTTTDQRTQQDNAKDRINSIISMAQAITQGYSSLFRS